MLRIGVKKKKQRAAIYVTNPIPLHPILRLGRMFCALTLDPAQSRKSGVTAPTPPQQTGN